MKPISGKLSGLAILVSPTNLIFAGTEVIAQASAEMVDTRIREERTMKTSMNGTALIAKFGGAIVVSTLAVLVSAQFASAQVSRAELESISTPNKVETPIGTLI
jgi:flagellar biosynthesis protein FlhB